MYTPSQAPSLTHQLISLFHTFVRRGIRPLLLVAIGLSVGSMMLSAKPSASDAAIKPLPYQPRFLELHHSFLDRAHEGPVDLLFLGDSIMYQWARHPEIWEHYAQYSPANFGIAGDKTQQVLWRIRNGELDDIQPQVVILMIGTNNSGSYTADQILAANTKIVEQIHEKLPDTKVLLLAIFPRGPRHLDENGIPRDDAVASMAVINEVNRGLAKLDNGDTIRFLDIGSIFKGPDGKLSDELMYDQLHLTKPGYKLWVEAMDPLLNEMMQAPSTESTQAQSENTFFDETEAITLFAFDDVLIPFSQGLKLEMNSPERHPANPVVALGAAGSVDSWAVQFYGSVIKDGDTYRMWYSAVSLEDRKDKSMPPSERWRVGYAESDDGVNWTKPDLGLVDYRGSTNNNLVKMEPFFGTLNLKVIKDEDDPDPSRRYKMGAHVFFQRNDRLVGNLAPYVSPDGLTWTYVGGDVEPIDANVPTEQTVLPPIHTEPVGGLFKWDDTFYTSGQNAMAAMRPYHGRVTRTFISPDFENWHGASAMGFVRTAQHELLGSGRSREGEQIHEGNAVWVRGNMLIGISGVWHGGVEWDDVTIDLGLVYSHDGIHFREALNEFVFLERGEDGQWDQGGLLQGQGFFNVGEQTRIYYGTWDPRNGGDPRGGVGIATLPRDRFADLRVSEKTKGKGDYQMPEIVSEFITAPIQLDGDSPQRIYINAEGLGEDATLRVELFAHNSAPIPAYSGDNAATVRDSGFQTPVLWNNQAALDDLPNRIRVKVSFEGSKNTDIRFSAMYIK